MELRRAVFHLGVVLAAAGPIDADQWTAIQREAAAIWQPYGVAVTWIDAEPECRSDAPAWLAPVDYLLHLAADTADHAALGAVRFRNGGPDDTIQLLYRPVYRMVNESAIGGWPVRNLPAPMRSRILSRALGRVLAHEIGHVLLDFPAHDRTGLMRPAFLPDDLVGFDHSHLRLSPAFVRRLEHRLRVLRAAASSPSP